MKTFASGAVRSNDADSVRYDLISPIGLRRLAETYAEGAKKYGDHNWLKGMPSSDLLNHVIAHLVAWNSGRGDEDDLAHAAWGLFAIMHFEETRPELIDRHDLEKVRNLSEAKIRSLAGSAVGKEGDESAAAHDPCANALPWIMRAITDWLHVEHVLDPGKPLLLKLGRHIAVIHEAELERRIPLALTLLRKTRDEVTKLQSQVESLSRSLDDAQSERPAGCGQAAATTADTCNKIAGDAMREIPLVHLQNILKLVERGVLPDSPLRYAMKTLCAAREAMENLQAAVAKGVGHG